MPACLVDAGAILQVRGNPHTASSEKQENPVDTARLTAYHIPIFDHLFIYTIILDDRATPEECTTWP